MSYAHLLPPHYRSMVVGWLKEDIPSFDYAGYVVGDKTEKAVLLCKSRGVLCGRPFVDAIFDHLGCAIDWHYEEGTELTPICEVAHMTGPIRALLQGERTALNCLTRSSGIATHARELDKIAKNANWPGSVAGTRKTTPGFRLVEKYALLVGSIATHRYDLSSMVMLKDNHIWCMGSISKAVKRAREVASFSSKIEVECRSVEEAREAITSGADVVMLDNFEPKTLQQSSALLKSEFPHVIIEASGGIRTENIEQYFCPTVDVISLSTTTQGYSTVDFSFKLLKEGRDPTNPTVSTVQ
ncbi:nicotinate-nucleotide pyrophosphorylase [carboxylating]-like [Dysidea avara]|uniref:nicotinate-nucleotide pyrophosphorylase [carboxylating]-like n=1 Tax=Dysidea avara TaxID=196820 RepID=UPI0033200EE0